MISTILESQYKSSVATYTFYRDSVKKYNRNTTELFWPAKCLFLLHKKIAKLLPGTSAWQEIVQTGTIFRHVASIIQGRHGMLNYTVSELVHLCVRMHVLANLQGQSCILTRCPVTESKCPANGYVL